MNRCTGVGTHGAFSGHGKLCLKCRRSVKGSCEAGHVNWSHILKDLERHDTVQKWRRRGDTRLILTSC